jgi:hypothetical protein
MRLHYKIRDGETIRYVNVMSLYPFVCKYHKLPIVHPITHVVDACKGNCAMLWKEGFIKCSILSPKRMYHPVLPYRCNNKPLFCLCKSCVMVQNTSDCTHDSVSEKSLVGTWVVDEVRLAVDKGYRLIEVYEFYEYEIT